MNSCIWRVEASEDSSSTYNRFSPASGLVPYARCCCRVDVSIPASASFWAAREVGAKPSTLLEEVRKRTKPRTVDLHEVFNAVLYLLKSSCQWRMLPEGFPNWCTVYAYFAKWSATDQDGVSVLERALSSLL